MSKKPTFYLDIPDNLGESRNKNHEVLLREWLCAVLVSQKLTRREAALFGYLVDQSRGLRYEVTKTQYEISLDTGIEERNLRKALAGLEEKGLFLRSRGTTRRGTINTYFLAMLWPEDFPSSPDFYLTQRHFPKLWDKVEAVFTLYVVKGQINPNLVHLTQRVKGQSNPPLEGQSNPKGEGHFNPQPDALSTVNTGCDASPSSFYSSFFSSFMDTLGQKIKSKIARQNIEKGIQKLCKEYTTEVVHERIALLYADKGLAVVKPNFHQYLEKNLLFYQSEETVAIKEERRRELQKMGSQLFLPIHEALVKAYKLEALERPNLGPLGEQLIRSLKIDLQKEYDYLRTRRNPAYLRAIENLFMNKFMLQYSN